MLLAWALLVQFFIIFLKLHMILVNKGTYEAVVVLKHIMQDPLLQVFVGDIRRAHEFVVMVVLGHDLHVNIFVIEFRFT
jgi:hypothetical protein